MIKTIIRLIFGPHRGKCAGCGWRYARNYDPRFDWFTCSTCDSDDIAAAVSEHVLYPNGRTP